jgi:hypothetical protein
MQLLRIHADRIDRLAVALAREDPTVSDVDDTPKPVPDWVQAHGITDRDTGIAAARASRQPLLFWPYWQVEADFRS